MNATQVAELLAAKRRPAPSPGPCTAQTTRCPSARDYSSELPACCRSHLITLMAATARALDELGAVWWADYGTLLGAVRNPATTWADYPWLPQDVRTTGGPAAGIVPHDKDADLGVELRAWDVAHERLRELVRPTHVQVFRYGPSLKVLLSAQNKTNIDLFFWQERPDGTLTRRGFASVDQFKGREFQRDMLYPLGTVQWEGLTLPAPRDPEAFLAMRYGPGWRTPIAANHDGQVRP